MERLVLQQNQINIEFYNAVGVVKHVYGESPDLTTGLKMS